MQIDTNRIDKVWTYSLKKKYSDPDGVGNKNHSESKRLCDALVV